MDRSDIEDLIARVALRDRAAFARLYDATAPKLLGISLRVLNNRDAAEDALQDTYIKIWHSADRFTAGKASPMSWLITIARNTAIDRLRARRKVEPVETLEETVAAGGLTPEGEVLAVADLKRFKECMSELPDQRQSAIRRVYLDGESYAECARALNIPLNTVRTWLRRSLISLRECLAR